MDLMANRRLLPRQYFTLIILTLIYFNSYSKGKHFEFTLTGKVTTKNGLTLVNQKIIVKFNNKIDTLTTDSEGRYSYTYSWGTPCATGVTSKIRKQLIIRKPKKIKYLYFHYGSNTIKVKNKPETLPDIEDKKLLNLTFK